jgi:hypothetical protein
MKLNKAKISNEATMKAMKILVKEFKRIGLGFDLMEAYGHDEEVGIIVFHWRKI